MNEPVSTDNLSAAVAKGLREAISDPQFWKDASAALQAHARDEAGGWLLGGLKRFAARAAWFIVVGLVIYGLGGWTALVAFIKSPSS